MFLLKLYFQKELLFCFRCQTHQRKILFSKDLLNEAEVHFWAIEFTVFLQAPDWAKHDWEKPSMHIAVAPHHSEQTFLDR